MSDARLPHARSHGVVQHLLQPHRLAPEPEVRLGQGRALSEGRAHRTPGVHVEPPPPEATQHAGVGVGHVPAPRSTHAARVAGEVQKAVAATLGTGWCGLRPFEDGPQSGVRRHRGGVQRGASAGCGLRGRRGGRRERRGRRWKRRQWNRHGAGQKQGCSPQGAGWYRRAPVDRENAATQP